MISSWLFPFVSGITEIVNKTPNMHTPEKIYIVQWNPRISMNDGRNFMLINAKF